MRYVAYIFFLAGLGACSVQNKMSRMAKQSVLSDSAITSGHIGIAIYDPQKDKYLYNHNGEKYFTPASNTKLLTWYAALSRLGDSLVGLRYHYNVADSAYIIQPTADPSFLLPEFKEQPVLQFLQSIPCNKLGMVNDFNFRTTAYGPGWAWDDYSEAYMPERSAFPINSNLVHFQYDADSISVYPKIFYEPAYSSVASWNKVPAVSRNKFYIKRKPAENYFGVQSSGSGNSSSLTKIPFITGSTALIKQIVEQQANCNIVEHSFLHGAYSFEQKIYSHPTDSLLKPMMHRSDNFFAEQTLLMLSNEMLGYMNTEAIIDTLLKSDLKNFPQKPQWVDGSGLSRYNLITPRDLVWLLHKAKKEFPWQRITSSLPTGGEGTLRNYYNSDSAFIYAKTGTLNNNCALSGYLITKKNKLLIFSVLVNNYPTGATPVRRAVEKFLKQVRQNF